MDAEKILQSDNLKKALIALGVLLLILVIFQAGVYVGARNAGFSERTGDNYYRAVEPGGVPPGPFGMMLSGGNGAAGQVISAAPPTFVVEDKDGTEKVISVGTETGVRLFKDATSSGAIEKGDYVIVIGKPDQNGEIQAEFVRVLPPPPAQ